MAKERTVRLSVRAKNVLKKAGMFISSDEALVKYMDDISGMIRDAKIALDDAGIIVDISNPENKDTSQEQRHPALNIYIDNLKLLISLMNALGLTGAKRIDMLKTLEADMKDNSKVKKKTEKDDFDFISG